MNTTRKRPNDAVSFGRLLSSLVSSSGDSQVIFGDGGECIPSINIA